jgi:glycosyltransferase involved in cell wall biosynthesis
VLSIVVIGRNEAENLERLGGSIRALKAACNFPIESIYIDSASIDNSLTVAEQQFDKVELLIDSEHLCASAGRYVGTCEAQYPWVFYIDGDMEICEEFFPVIRDLNQLDSAFVGLIGLYVHRFDNGHAAIQTFRRPVGEGNRAMHFGGAVILRKAAVLQAGNWDPALYGKEEIELYARLGDGRQVVKFVNLPMVYHYSEYYTRVAMVKRLIAPAGGLGKVFWGYGQSVRAAFVKRKLWALARLDYELYAFWFSLLLVIGVGLSGNIAWALALATVLVTSLSLWSRPGSIVRYLMQPLSLFTGWWRYFPYFRPMLRRWDRKGDQAA